MCDSNKPFIEFCCMGHEAYFTEDFQSDDEDICQNFDFKSHHAIDFIPEVYEDVQKELVRSRFQEEKYTQCDSSKQFSISQLSYMPSFSTNSKDKVLLANPRTFSISHLARVFFPVEAPIPFQCKICKVVYKSNKSLRGHLSRKH